MEVQTQVKNFLERRPKTICAYSSNIAQEKNDELVKVDVDLLLVVDDIKKWHLENIESNPDDYSYAGKLFYTESSKEKIKGFTGISYQFGIKRELSQISLSNNGAKKLEKKIIHLSHNYNYGVIEYSDLERQLCSWNHISVANIFQNNVVEIIHSDKVEELVTYNKRNLFVTALFLLGDIATLTELYEMILRLSKIRISKDQEIKLKEEFIRTYGKTNEFYKVSYEEFIVINREKVETYFLPAYLENYLSGISKKDIEQRKKAIVNFFDKKYREEKYYQTLQNFRTNGIACSTEYAFQKLKKRCTKKN